jgi:hypothetical protein
MKFSADLTQWIVLLQGDGTIGPFETEEDAQQYVNSDWQKSDMTILPLYFPEQSEIDRTR